MPEGTLPLNQLRALVERVFPNVELELMEREPIRSFQHHLERIRLGFLSPGGEKQELDLFLRLYRGDFSWWTLQADLAAREASGFDYLKALGFRVPHFLARGQDPGFSLCARSHGASVASRYETASLEALAATLASLHKKSQEHTPPLSLPDLSLPILLPRLKAWAMECESEELSQMAKWATEPLQGTPESRAFVHGDANGKNFLISAGGLTVLDLEECGRGDPRLDLATLARTLPPTSHCEGFAAFLRAYERETLTATPPLQPWIDFLQVRDIITAHLAQKRQARGQGPRFDSGHWLRQAEEFLPLIRARMG